MTHCDWFGGRLATRPSEFFANLACADNAFDVYPEIAIDPAAIAAWKRDKQGAIIGDQLAQRLGLRVGDRITLAGLVLRGRLAAHHRRDLQRARTHRRSTARACSFAGTTRTNAVPARQKDQVGWVFTRVDDPSQSPRVARAIDQLFDTRDVQTATMSERGANSALMGGVSAVLGALDVGVRDRAGDHDPDPRQHARDGRARAHQRVRRDARARLFAGASAPADPGRGAVRGAVRRSARARARVSARAGRRSALCSRRTPGSSSRSSASCR